MLLTHDVSTVTRYAYERLERVEKMPGIIEAGSRASVGEVIEDILLLVECSLDGEWEGQIIYLPLR